MHLIAVFLQVVLDAALEEVQLGLQLLREAKHAVLTPGQVGVVAQEAQPGGGGDNEKLERKKHHDNIYNKDIGSIPQETTPYI